MGAYDRIRRGRKTPRDAARGGLSRFAPSPNSDAVAFGIVSVALDFHRRQRRGLRNRSQTFGRIVREGLGLGEFRDLREIARDVIRVIERGF